MATHDHTARNARKAINERLHAISVWLANPAVLDGPHHYTRDPQPGTPSPPHAKVTRAEPSDPTAMRVHALTEVVGQVHTKLDMVRQDIEDACIRRGWRPGDEGDVPPAVHPLHGTVVAAQSQRITDATSWLTDQVIDLTAESMRHDEGDVRDRYLQRHAVWPAVIVLMDTDRELQRIIDRWIMPAKSTNHPRCSICGYRARRYRDPDRCRPCYKRQRRQEGS